MIFEISFKMKSLVLQWDKFKIALPYTEKVRNEKSNSIL